jgi:hypothetical protein
MAVGNAGFQRAIILTKVKIVALGYCVFMAFNL